MKTIALSKLGGLGNNLFRYAFARALAEQNGHELRCQEWPGEKIFTLDGAVHARPTGTEDLVIDGYRQTQADLIYTRADCRRWFDLKPYWKEKLRMSGFGFQPIPLGHVRRGDYVGSSYPLISKKAVWQAMLTSGIDMEDGWTSVSDEKPAISEDFPGDFSFLPDFYRMMSARTLFRGNSSFSYWASVLGHGRVFSPIITGLAGGVEHDNVPYVEGNWPALAELPCVTDLHLKEA